MKYDILLFLLLSIVCLSFSSNSIACTSNKAILDRIEYKLAIKIYSLNFRKSNKYFVINNKLWDEAVQKARFITLDNFACKDVLQVRGY